ncbi:hypothetical protein BU17DRAFT_94144 [Hysterangium stoloniferum]|nr:hypothetical protein BU17DRAFT_94144 [Hysterangium stoloniferum]
MSNRSFDTPLSDFDHKSPLPCIIVTPSSATEYHIAFHHKDSPLKYSKFAVQQEQQGERQQQSRFRRPFFTAINSLVDSPPALPHSFETTIHRFPNKLRVRTALILAIPIFIMACHLLATMLLRHVGLGHSLFRGTLSRGGFSTAAAAHLRAQRDAQPQPETTIPEISPGAVRIPTADHLNQAADLQPIAALN